MQLAGARLFPHHGHAIGGQPADSNHKRRRYTLKLNVLVTATPVRTRAHGLGGNSITPAAGSRPALLMTKTFPCVVRYSAKLMSEPPPEEVAKSTEIWFPLADEAHKIHGRSGERLNAELTWAPLKTEMTTLVGITGILVY